MTEKKSALTAATVQSANEIKHNQDTVTVNSMKMQEATVVQHQITRKDIFGISDCSSVLTRESKGIAELTSALSIALNDAVGYENGLHLLSVISQKHAQEMSYLDKKIETLLERMGR